MLATHLIGHELGHNILQIARDGGVLTDAQKAELAQLFQNKDGSFDEEQFAEAFARELKFALAKAQGQRAGKAPKTRVGKALKPIVDFFVALATSVRNWRVGRGMDAETGAPLQAQSVLEAFLQRQREEAKAMAELNRRLWEQSKKDGAALAEALERSPHQIVLDDDGTPLKFHINKETRDNWDSVILALEYREEYPLDQQWWSTPKTMFYGAPDILRFINAKHPGLFKSLTGEEFNEQLPFMIDPSTLVKIYEGTSGRSVGTAHDHNLTIEDLYRLIDEIDSPLAVFRDVSGNGESLIFLTQLTEKSVVNGRVYEDPVIVPIRISQSRDGGIAHYRVSSAYGIGNKKRNAILDELDFNPKTALYINRKKLNAIAGNNMARFGRGGSRNQTAHGHGTWRFAHDILNKLSSARNVPDEVGLSQFAPDWATPSVPSIIDQTETETQEENNESYHDLTQNSAAELERARAEINEVRRQYEGTDQWMNAPNGNPTNLTEEQWLQVRTPSFKAWFGDWENHPETIHPKLLDENGEPRVFWHNSPAADIRAFDPARSRAAMDIQGTYFSPDSQDAAGYGQNAYPVFIALKHPADQATAYAGFTPGSSPDAGAVRAQELRDQGYDGVIVEDSDYDSGIAEVIVLDPRVIKSATDNRGSFDPANPDIRFHLRSAAEKVRAATRNVTRDVFAQALEEEVRRRVERRAIHIRDGRDDDGRKIVEAALRFYDLYAEKVIELSNGMCVYFAPALSEARLTELSRELGREATDVDKWVEYAIHAVTNDTSTKTRRRRSYQEQKDAGLEAIEEIVRQERVLGENRQAYTDEASFVFVGEVGGRVYRVVTRLDDDGNADLREVTVVPMSRDKEAPPTIPLSEAVEKRHQGAGYSPSTKGTIAQTGADVKPGEQWHDPTAGGAPEFTETPLG